MADSLQQLISDVADTTGAAAPALLGAEAPVLQEESLSAEGEAPPYLVGLIGGKDVGKSALINALVGQSISASTSFGPGTETVVAYVHQSQAAAVKALLDRAAPGRYEIVPHAIGRLQRQALLDLPDIDSRYSDHIDLTRRMLRHMLFPVWVQSVEKYADLQPQQLLAAVAAGNDPANFLFVLNKADQVSPDAADELRADFAARIARTLGRTDPPRVFVVSARALEAFDFPSLQKTLSRQKDERAVRNSIELAGRQRSRSMLSWLDAQKLPERMGRIDRLSHQAEDLIAARLTGPLLENALPRMLEDPSHRLGMVDAVMDARAARWPIVNILHTLLSPLTSLWRRNAGAGPTPQALVDSALSVQGRDLPDAVQGTFALLHQTHPLTSVLYQGRRLWESAPAAGASDDLRDALIASLAQQRQTANHRLARRGIIAPVIRWLLTLGAVLWFPIVQPVLELMLKNNLTQTLRGGLVLAVELFSAAYLLRSAAFLAIWFVFLWLVLRWDTNRRVRRLLSRWRGLEGRDGTISPSSVALRWGDELLDPIHIARQREESLAQRAETIRESLDKSAA